MPALTRLFSRSKDIDNKTEAAKAAPEITLPSDHSPPPPYIEDAHCNAEDAIEPPDLTAGFSDLKFALNATGIPRPEECIAHLKLLECFYRLRQTVGSTDGLYGINDSVVTQFGLVKNDEAKLLTQLAEKRWAIYVTRAVDRFEAWTNATFPSHGLPTIEDIIEGGNLRKVTESLHCVNHEWISTPAEMWINETSLPPVDVLLVWHAFCLNPRAFFEDCLRKGRLLLWHQKFPWEHIAPAIDANTFLYKPGSLCEETFMASAKRAWHNDYDNVPKKIKCPKCSRKIEVSYSIIEESAVNAKDSRYQAATQIEAMLSSGRGYCDKNFQAYCSPCGHSISREYLKLGKFFRDLEALTAHQLPMPGTVYSLRGIPTRVDDLDDPTAAGVINNVNQFFSSHFAEEVLRPAWRSYPGYTMSDIRRRIETKLQDRVYTAEARKKYPRNPVKTEQAAIRRLMSRYWDNDTEFSMDLVGAVMRQCSFTEKMHNIDWLHSPALNHTMARLITKYKRFLTIMLDLKSMAVPTLDVDLAWHTAQLNPHKYMHFTALAVKQFVDHDDKVAETKLHDAFAKTSKRYQQLYLEQYAQCTCWYCEATRESQSSKASRLFRSISGQGKAVVHPETDPLKSVHISAHNAVRPTDYTYTEKADVQVRKLEDAYAAACKRAKSQGRKAPQRDHYYYSDAYGYPVYIPAYSPFFVPLPYTPCLYTSNVGCMAYETGAPGNCCSGTCGAAQGTAGGCGGMCGSNGASCSSTSCSAGASGGDGGSSGCGSGCGGCGGCGG